MRKTKRNNNFARIIKLFYNNDASKERLNIKILISISILSVFGLFILLSASSYLTIKYEYGRFHYIIRQGIFLLLGFILMLIVSKLDYKIYYKYSKQLYVFTIILLLLCYVPFFSFPINGARRAIKILITFMPSDIAKLFIITSLATFLIKNKKYNNDWKNGFIYTMLIIGIPTLLIFMQTDFSTSIVLLLSCMFVYFAYGFKFKFLIILLPSVIIGFYSMRYILKPYQIDRLTAFLNPEAYYDDISWQVLNGLFGFSRGGLTGVGFGKGIYKHGYLSDEVINDMIFVVVGEEFGFVGSLVILLLVFTITFYVIKEALRSKDLFAKLVCFGIGIIYFLQSIVNIGVTVSIIPNTGITLPFVSNGGTSLIMFFIMFGVVLNISRQNRYFEIVEKTKNKKMFKKN